MTLEQILGIIFLVILLLIVLHTFRKGLHFINDNEIGLVKKNFTLRVFNSKTGFGEHIAIKGEVGFQADTLSPGWHWKLPGMYTIFRDKIIIIKNGEIGLIKSHYGKTKEPGQNLPPLVECKNYQDAKAFFLGGGYKGIQMDFLPPGNWSINTKAFKVLTKDRAHEENINPALLKDLIIETGWIGIVTTHEGRPLNTLIAGSIIKGHSNFRNPDIFLKNGGFMGLQEEVLEEGRFTLNPLFVSVNIVPVTKIETGTVGVVLTNVGKSPNETGSDVLVDVEFKGVQKHVLEPGTHKINTSIVEVFVVPLNQISLKWSDVSKDKSRYDSELTAIRLYSKDKFEFKLPLSQTIRIKPESAPLLIKRMGVSNIDSTLINSEADVKAELSEKKYKSIKQFVYRFLEPLVRSTFQLISVEYSALEFYEHSGEIQRNAAEQIRAKLEFYGVEAISTVIDNVDLPAELDEIVRVKQEIDSIEDKNRLEFLKKNQVLVMAELENEIRKKNVDVDTYEFKAKYGDFDNYLRYIAAKSLENKQMPLYYAPGSDKSNIEPLLVEQIVQKLKEQTININPTYQNLTISESEAKAKLPNENTLRGQDVKLDSELKDDQRDKNNVLSSVYAPKEARQGDSILIQVFAHTLEQSPLLDDLAKRADQDSEKRITSALNKNIKIGSELHFQLLAPGLTIDEPSQFCRWIGEIALIQFEAAVPFNQPIGTIIITIIVSDQSIPIGQIKFKLGIVKSLRTGLNNLQFGGTINYYKQAFISYATRDRQEVLKRVQMLNLVKLKFFHDLLTLEPGEKWESLIYKYIEECDVFFLFWSEAASESEWVLKEIKHALKCRANNEDGFPEIIPVVIDGPPPAKPPTDLNFLHFNDKLIYFINSR